MFKHLICARNSPRGSEQTAVSAFREFTFLGRREEEARIQVNYRHLWTMVNVVKAAERQVAL